MAKTKVATKALLENNEGISISFTDGERIELRMADLSPEIVTNLALHGAKQKIGDAYSGEQDPAAARALASKVMQQLIEGKWSAIREGGGGRISDLAQALSRVTGQAVDACVDKLADMSKEAKASLRSHPKVKTALAEISLEKAKAAADAAGETAFEF